MRGPVSINNKALVRPVFIIINCIKTGSSTVSLWNNQFIRCKKGYKINNKIGITIFFKNPILGQTEGVKTKLTCVGVTYITISISCRIYIHYFGRQPLVSAQ